MEEHKRDFNADQINQSKLINHYSNQPEYVTVHYKELSRLKVELMAAKQRVEEIEAERIIACEEMDRLGVKEIVLRAIAIRMYERHLGFSIYKKDNTTAEEQECPYLIKHIPFRQMM